MISSPVSNIEMALLYYKAAISKHKHKSYYHVAKNIHLIV